MASDDRHDIPPPDDSYVDLGTGGAAYDGGGDYDDRGGYDGGAGDGYDDGGFDDGPSIGPAHVPPHDLHAEQAVLGAMMLSEQARYGLTVEDGLKPEDFYAPQHATIYEAIRRLYAENQPIDSITVVEQLRRTGTLDEAGGREAILQLTAAVTEVAALPRHAQIVQGMGKLRRLLQATYEIQTAVLKGEGEPDIIVEQAQTAVFDVSEDEDNKGLRTVGSFVDEAIKELEALEKDGRDITGLETGFRDLDKETAGLQPGAMVVLAARPAMGKSAFVTNLAENVALQGKGAVALFSLEMPERELLQRVLASQAAIKGDDVRKGRIGDRWGDLLEVADKLAQAPLYIDDSSDIGIMEIRAKARRLHASHAHGVSLVIVDYLQLMRADGRAENRVQQIGEMSRGLKILAQELSCPVIALSQLSRGVDSRPDKRPLLSDLRECVTGDTLVVLADGRRVRIDELVRATPRVLAVDAFGSIVERDTDLVWQVGRKPVFELRLASGRTMRATAEHRVMAGGGWQTIDELVPGDRVAVSRRLPEPETTVAWPQDRVVLLGHLVGDGSYVSGQPLRYTTASEENSIAVADAARREFGSTVNRHEHTGTWHQLVLAGNGTRWAPAGVNLWLRELGIFGQRSHDKHLPEDVFRLPNEQIALLLRHLWATDGCIWSRPASEGRKRASRIYFSTCSRRLAADVAALLLRFGIVARTSTPDDGGVSCVDVTGWAAQLRFLDEIGVFGPRVAQGEALRASIGDRVPTTNVDTLPIEVWDQVRHKMRAKGISQRAMTAARGTSYGGTSHFRFAPSRATVASYAAVLEDERLRVAATSDVFWDRIVSIEPAGEEEVYDLTVPGLACWLADGIVTHNSGNIEQDADLVMFLYRDDYYNKETAEPGVAELIIAKNRSGRTDTIRLLFQGEYPRFLTMAQPSQGMGGPPANFGGPPSGGPPPGGGPPLPGGGPPLPRT
ncbi:replicative DNA helicase [Patulibacter minatonensis]|uniref:replicative DNA helicase n=1 Tax=Patulibacter minatonensis TaxID=298163 RepID=UPI000A05A8F2|nr:replicative DNA helicase [Patulibacter minatonensis]